MFSNGEMEVLSAISLGNDNIRQISENVGKSIPQVYRLVDSLRNMNAVHLSDGVVIPERKTHIALLLDILRNSDYAKVSLSGYGLDILTTLTKPMKVADISSNLNLHQTSVSKKIKQLDKIGMIKKEGRTYVINDRLWPDLRPMIDAYAEYKKTNDMRVPPGSKIYYSSEKMVIFADEHSSNLSKTAFSKYEEYGIKFHPGTYFYVNPPMDVTLRDVFIHSLMIISAAKNWRLKMMALILYAKFKSELRDVEHPVRDEMDRVLSGERVDGWVKLDEMQERADVYGVVLR